MTPFQPFTTRSIKTGVLLCYLLLCLGQANAQTIQLLPAPEDSSGQYNYYGDPILFNGKLYLRYYNSSFNYRLVAYDGQNFTIYPQLSGFNGSNRGYQGDPVIFKDKLYLLYRDNAYVSHLIEFDDTELKIIDNLAGYNILNTGTNPFIQGDKMYLSCSRDSGGTVLMAFDGQNLQPVATPAAYVGVNRGYLGVSGMKGDTTYLAFRRMGGGRDLAYLVDGVLSFVLSPPGYDGTYRGFGGYVVPFAGKLFARYENNTGEFELAVLENDSLQFQSIPDSLGGPLSLQSMYEAIVLGDQLLLLFEQSGGYRILGAYRDGAFRLIPSSPEFEADGAGVYGPPLAYQGKAYMVYYNKDGYARTAIFDGTDLDFFPMPANEPEASLGEVEQFYPVNGKLYTLYSNKEGHNQLAVLEGDQFHVFDHPSSTANTLSFYGPVVVFQGDLYFKYALNGNSGVLAKLSNTTAVPSAPGKQAALCLYPNPSLARQISIELDPAASGLAGVQVLDLKGHALRTIFYQKNENRMKEKLGLSGLPAGVYVVQVLLGDGQRVVRKLVLM